MKLWEKIVWGIVIGIFTLMAVYGILATVAHFVRQPMATDLTVSDNGLMKSPDVMICPLNPINSTYAKSLRGDPKLAKYILSMAVPHSGLGSWTEGTFEWQTQTLDREAAMYNEYLADQYGSAVKAYGSLGLQCQGVLLSCSIGGKDFPCCNYTTTTPTSFGPCLYLNLSKTDYVIESEGLYAGLRVTAAVPKETLSDLGKSLQDNLPKLQSSVMLLDRWQYYPNPAFSLAAGKQVDVAVRTRRSRKLSSRADQHQFRHMVSPLDKKFGHSGMRPDLDCFSACLLLEFRRSCQCLPPYAQLAWPTVMKYPPRDGNTKGSNLTSPDTICSLRQLIHCPRKAIMETLSSLARAGKYMRQCTLPCERQSSGDTTEYISSPVSFDITKSGESSDSIKSTFNVYFPRLEEEVLSEYYTMTMFELMAKIAVTICIYVVLFAILWYLVKLCKYVCRCGWKRDRLDVTSDSYPPSSNYD